MRFSDVCFRGKCDVCGADTDVACVASTMGPVSYAYCKHCLDLHLEPYHAMVAYVSCAGHFPNDINSYHQTRCRQILENLNISEEQFIKDVDTHIYELDKLLNADQEQSAEQE